MGSIGLGEVIILLIPIVIIVYFILVRPFVNRKISQKEIIMPHGNFEFKGKGLGFWWLMIWTGFLTIITIGLFWPWAYSAQQRWLTEHTYIDGKQLVFKGTGIGLFGTWLLVVFLSIITLGIYAPWGYCRIKRWQVNNQYFADDGDI